MTGYCINKKYVQGALQIGSYIHAFRAPAMLYLTSRNYNIMYCCPHLFYNRMLFVTEGHKSESFTDRTISAKWSRMQQHVWSSTSRKQLMSLHFQITQLDLVFRILFTLQRSHLYVASRTDERCQVERGTEC